MGAATWTAGSLLEGCAAPTSVEAPKYQGKRLVLISLDGGHDGLHAIAPKNNDVLAKLRPKIYADTLQKGIPISLASQSDFVLHRNLKPWLASLEKEEFRIIPNVGLPLNEWNGSHFVSQDFWSGLSEDLQQVIAQSALVSAQYEREDSIKDDLVHRQLCLDNGINVTDPDAEIQKQFRDRATMIYNKYTPMFGQTFIDKIKSA